MKSHISIASIGMQVALVLLFLCLSVSTSVKANSNGRLIGTGGAMSIEGSAGGGIVPWAMLAGYADEQEWGGAAWLSGVESSDFSLNAFGAAMTFSNRIELSFARQSLDNDAIAPGQNLEQNIIGLKTRLYGDLIYSRAPQLSLGIMYKQNDNADIESDVGAKDDSGVDIYLAASKLWLDGPFHRSVFLNGTLRASRANQMGLLGFGGDLGNKHELLAEFSAGFFINRSWVLGTEYRQKPNLLGFAREDDWKNVFVGWFPNKRIAVVAAWVGLGSIAGLDNQDSVYLSLQLSQ